MGFFVAWHDELVTTPLTPANFDMLSERTPAWKWYMWDLKSSTATPVPNAEPFAALPSVTTQDGRMFYADQQRVTENGGLGIVPFYELTATGIKPAFTGFGSAYYMLRVR